MGTPDPRIDRWLSKERAWRDELVVLRRVLLTEEVTEALKWRQPCYVAHGGNIALLASMSDSVSVSFLKGVLLDDPLGCLERPGPNSRSARYMRFHDLESIAAGSDSLRTFVRAAIEIEKRGVRVDLPTDDISLPDEMVVAMDEDPELAAAFRQLTHGRRRGWAIHFSAPKKTETRRARIEKARYAILDGKGLHDR